MVDTNQNGKFAHSLESEQATPQRARYIGLICRIIAQPLFQT